MNDQTGLPPDLEPRAPQRRRLPKSILGSTPVLPALVTMLNGIAGFAAIHYASKGQLGSATLGHLTVSAWLIFAAMIFDAVDGRVARMTRQATDFGAQLDSLCDVISFGVAPAILMVNAFIMAIGHFDIPQPYASTLGKAVMAVGALYACCAVLRLARFNIENAPDVLSHMEFKGLPSPGAAATVASMVLLFAYLQNELAAYLESEVAAWKSILNVTVATALPGVTLLTALLMISGFRYPHLMNRLIQGRRPIGFIVKALVLIVAGIVFWQMALVLAALAFAASGPVSALVRKLRPGSAPEPSSSSERPADEAPQ